MSVLAEKTPRSADDQQLRSRGQWTLAAHRLTRQPVTLAALGLLVALFVAGAFAREIAPQGWNIINLSPRWANQPPTLNRLASVRHRQHRPRRPRTHPLRPPRHRADRADRRADRDPARSRRRDNRRLLQRLA